ncbi:MAG: hypothetical protein KJ607_10430, partial [Bacteroidetes bacterium]|nr:hypothetical protein [Bacteroidota bacterium]
LEEAIDTLFLGLSKTAPGQNYFTLHGVSLETGDPGVLYHAIGVNGAKAGSFLRCDLFVRHLKALEPDWIVVSLGTNDVYVDQFDKNVFAFDFNRLIENIREAAPDAPILLTTPGDSYRFGDYPNPHTKTARDIIFKLAKLHNCAVYDFYRIMGGFDSVARWYEEGLSAHDKLHFSKEGYVLQADLLFCAFMDAYDSYIDKMDMQKHP